MKIKFATFIVCFLLTNGNLTAQINYNLSFNLSDLKIGDKIENNLSYQTIEYNGLYNTAEIGKPSLPVKYLRFIIPLDKEFDAINITPSSAIDSSLNYPVFPVQSPVPLSGTAFIPDFTYPDSVVYHSANWPVAQGIYINTGYFDKFNKIITIAIYPIVYYPILNKITIYRNIQININLKSASTVEQNERIWRSEKNINLYQGLLKSMVQNPQDVVSYSDTAKYYSNKSSDRSRNWPLPTYEYVIITTDALKNSFADFVAWKKQKGIDIGIVTTQEIYNSYDGDYKWRIWWNGGWEYGPLSIEDDAGKIREYLKDAYYNGTVYALMGGDMFEVPARIGTAVQNLDNIDHFIGSPESCLIPTDWYYSDLSGDWNVDADFFPGDPNTPLYGEPIDDQVGLYPNIFVGRILCNTDTQIQNWTRNVINYEKVPITHVITFPVGGGSWDYLKHSLLVQSDVCQQNGEANDIKDEYNSFSNYFSHTIVEETPSNNCEYDYLGNSINPSNGVGTTKGADVIHIWHENDNGDEIHYGLVGLFGHGSPRSLMTMSNLDGLHGPPCWAIRSEDAFEPDPLTAEINNGLDNLNSAEYPSILSSVACDEAPFDKTSGTPNTYTYYPSIEGYMNIAEAFTTNSTAGGAAFLGNTRSGWSYYSKDLYIKFIEQLYATSNPDPCTKLGPAECVSKSLFATGYNLIWASAPYYLLFSHNLIGCPETNIWIDSPKQFSITCNPSSICINTPTTITGNITMLPNRSVRVSLFKDNEIIDKIDVVSNSSGVASFYFYSLITINSFGSLLLTATADGYQPQSITIPVICCPLNSTPLIASTQTWTIDRPSVNQWIEIPYGQTLTIKSKIAFTETAGIKVETGGTLILDGGTLTSACNSTWKGIEVQGNRYQSQSSISGIYQQGLVKIINEGTIEKAICGIKTINSTFPLTSYETTGGIIQATNAKFLNCITAVDFEPYKNIVSGNEMPNRSYFSNCIFETTETENLYDIGSAPINFINLNGVSGIYFAGCDFKNSDLAHMSSVRGNGIVSNSSRFFVTGRCTSPTIPCTSWDEGNFEHLVYGIKANNPNPIYTVTVRNNNFTDNFRTICLYGANKAEINDNDFDVGENAISNDAYGLYIEGCSGYQIQKNNFTTTHGGRYGIIVANSGINNNIINNNIISNFRYACQIEGRNGSSYEINRTQLGNIPSPLYSGLVLKCNQFSNNDFFDIGLTNYTPSAGNEIMGIISPRQGYCSDATTPAGNEFSTGCSYNLYSESDVSSYTYSFHSPDGGIYDPQNVFGPITLNQCPEVYDVNTTCVLPNPNDPSALMNTISTRSQEINTLAGLLDGGNTQTLLNAISQTNINQGTLKNLLMAASPYLTDTVLIATIKRTQPLANGHIKDIMVANSSLTNKVMIELTKMPLPPGIRKQIVNAQNGTSARTVLEEQITSKQTELSFATDELMRAFLNDTTTTGTDAIINFFTTVPNVESKKIAAQAYLANNNCSGLQSMLSLVPQTNTEDVNFVKYFTILADLCVSGKSIDSLSSTQILQMQEVANSGATISLNARIILAQLADSNITETIENIELPDSLSIRGNLYESTDCGSNAVASDTLVIKDYWGNIMNEVTPVVTGQDGWFSFDAFELAQLKNEKYTITTKDNFAIDTTLYYYIQDWLQNSPLELNLSKVTEVWQSVYNSPDSIFATGQSVVIQGDIYSIGTAFNQNKDKDIVIIKNDPIGNVIWTSLYNSGTGTDDEAAAIYVDSLQNIFVLGTIGAPGHQDIALILYDSNGVFKWKSLYNYKDKEDRGFEIANDLSGNIFILGTGLNLYNDMDGLLLKYNPKGQLLWSHSIPGYDHKTLFAAGIHVDASGAVTAVISDTTANAKTLVYKYASNGELAYRDTLTAFNACAYMQDIAGNNFIAGNIANTEDVGIKKFSSNGSLVWSTSIYGYMENNPTSDYLVMDSLGNLTVLDFSKMGFALARINPQGTKMWYKENKGGWYHFLYDLDMTIDKLDNIYVAATADYMEKVMTSYVYLYKFDPTGTMSWSQEAKRNTASDITVSENLNIYISGTNLFYANNSSTPTYGLVTHKYSQCYSAINLRSMETIDSANQQQIGYYLNLYPNPNNGTMEINYSIPDEESGRFEIYDLAGKVIFSSELKGGSNKQPITLTGFGSGVYYYRAYTTNRSLVKDKVVVIK
jgi:hypothetical protein